MFSWCEWGIRLVFLQQGNLEMAYSFFSSSSLLDILWIALSIVFRYKAGKEQVDVSETLRSEQELSIL